MPLVAGFLPVILVNTRARLWREDPKALDTFLSLWIPSFPPLRRTGEGIVLVNYYDVRILHLDSSVIPMKIGIPCITTV